MKPDREDKEIFNEMKGVKILTTLYVYIEYWHVRMSEVRIEKMKFVWRYGTYK